MIKAERLKKLIEKEAIIYVVYRSNIYRKDAKFIECIDKTKNGDYVLEWQDNKSPIIEFISLERIFQTKSEAEFYAKYGNIEKTIKMPVPPTWEEFKKKKAYAFKKDEDVFLLKQDRYDGNDMFIIDKITFGEHKNIKTWHFVEDFETVYYEALDKIVELWKEEV